MGGGLEGWGFRGVEWLHLTGGLNYHLSLWAPTQCSTRGSRRGCVPGTGEREGGEQGVNGEAERHFTRHSRSRTLIHLWHPLKIHNQHTVTNTPSFPCRMKRAPLVFVQWVENIPTQCQHQQMGVIKRKYLSKGWHWRPCPGNGLQSVFVIDDAQGVRCAGVHFCLM